MIFPDIYKNYIKIAFAARDILVKELLIFHQGVTLDDFKAFNRFLNNIDDFIVAVRMFNMMHEPIGQGKCLYFKNGRIFIKLYL